MADNNFVEQKPESPIDQFVDEVGIPDTPTDVKGPSTPESQERASKEQEFTSQIKKKQQEQKRLTNKEPSFTEAQHAVLEDLKTSKEQQAQKDLQAQALKNEQEQKKELEITEALEKYQQGKEFAAQEGIPFKVDEEFEAAIAQREQRQSAALEMQEKQLLQEEQDQQQLEQAKIDQQAKIEEEQIRKQTALQQAKLQADLKQKEAFQQRQQKLQESLSRENEELNSIDPNRFWNSKSTGEKIVASIGLILAGAGAGLSGQPNQAIQLLQKQIDNDIESQKLTNEQKLAKKQHALKLVELDLKKLESKTQNDLRKTQINKMISEMQQGQKQLQNDRMAAKKLASTDGLTREEVFALDDKMQKKMVILGDGRFRPAVNAELAKKLNMETIPQAKDSIRGLTRLNEILDMPMAEANPVLRAEAATIKQALKGALRLELFGPGVMTDFESKMADKIIGDPTAVLTFDARERARLNALMSKVKQGTRDKIRQSGVALPKTRNEKMLDQFTSKNKSIKRPEAINALRKLGYWDENESPF
jgi:chemotaxis protein histidine kinase CheA